MGNNQLEYVLRLHIFNGLAAKSGKEVHFQATANVFGAFFADLGLVYFQPLQSNARKGVGLSGHDSGSGGLGFFFGS